MTKQIPITVELNNGGTTMMRMVTTGKTTIVFNFGEGNIVTKTIDELLSKTEAEEVEERKAKVRRSEDQASPSRKHPLKPEKEKNKKMHCTEQQPSHQQPVFVLPKLKL